MNIKIYKVRSDETKFVSHEIEIEDADVITMVRKVLSKGVVGKE